MDYIKPVQETYNLKSWDRASRNRLKGQFIEKGWQTAEQSIPYAEWRIIKDGLTITMYQSGKMLVQGKTGSPALQEVSGILDGINVSPKSPSSHSFTGIPKVSHIGSDEVGKGDFFGPLVVTAAYVKVSDYDFLNQIGVTDSKKLSDKKIVDIVDQVKSRITYETYVMNPTEFNQMYRKVKNVSILLANLHAEVVKSLLNLLEKKDEECSLVVIDQFSKSKKRLIDAMRAVGLSSDINLRQFHKGESDPAVATASVIARAEFLSAWETLEVEWGMKFPKGAVEVVDVARDFVEKFGKDALKAVAKVNFKTVRGL